jgi:hypothetical protein
VSLNRNPSRWLRWRGCGALACGLAFAPLAQAVLGERVDSIHADQMRLQGVRRLSTTLQYQVHDIRLADGATVRQFATPAGQVFALAWRSHLKLQLQPLLGQYFSPYSAARQAAAPGQGFARQSALAQGGLVVRESAHLGLFAGLAYVRQLVPEGVDPNALH